MVRHGTMLDFDWDEELFDLWEPETFEQQFFVPEDNDPEEGALETLDELF